MSEEKRTLIDWICSDRTGQLGDTFSDDELDIIATELATLRTRAEAAEAERDAMRAERDEAIKHVRIWVSWCEGPAQPHPYDNVQAAKAFLSTLQGEG